MKILSAVLAVLAVAIYSAAPILAEGENGKDTPAVWKTETRAEYPEYPVVWRFNGCTVLPHSRGKGVMVNANDPNWYGNFLSQHFTISRNKYGGTRKEESFWLTRSHRGGGSALLNHYAETTIGYDVFYVKCHEATKSLPLAVRKAFLGYYALVPE